MLSALHRNNTLNEFATSKVNSNLKSIENYKVPLVMSTVEKYLISHMLR